MTMLALSNSFMVQMCMVLLVSALQDCAFYSMVHGMIYTSRACSAIPLVHAACQLSLLCCLGAAAGMLRGLMVLHTFV